MESSEILSPLLNSVCKNQLKLQIDRIEGSVNSVTPSELSLQKSAQITNLYDIWFGNSDTPIHLSLQKTVQITNWWNRAFYKSIRCQHKMQYLSKYADSIWNTSKTVGKFIKYNWPQPYWTQFAKICSNYKIIGYMVRKFWHPYGTQFAKKQKKLQIDRIEVSEIQTSLYNLLFAKTS